MSIDKEQLYMQYHDKILGYIIHRTGNVDLAEDLTSDVFVKAYQALDRYDEKKAAVSTWIYTITRNTLTDYFRRPSKMEEIPDDLASNDDIESELINEGLLSDLADALDELPERQRDIIVLRYYHDHPLTEIASMMNISYGILKLEHRKALAALRKRIS
ncbi:MAG: sigma-70 family RNA polymerase sigma factor [Lachnospiraceae bacterium]|nr:sigma-70 family RNA polymerase sigma factor [Lachnospiraceae bacterium]